MIPRALRECAQWVVWKTFIKRQGKKVKKVKMPYDPKTGKPAQVNNPLTWGTYSEACRAAYRYDGLGFVFTADDHFVGVDIDHCIDENGHIREDAQELVDRFESYCEKSPSGTGLHIIITADGLKDGRRGIRTDDIEVYAQDRYFTVTGNAILDAPIQNGQAVLDELVSRIAPAVKQEKKPASRKKAEPAVLKGSDEKLLEALFKQKNGRILQALYNGEDAWTGDRSRDDLYFCWNVNFRNGNDLAQTDRIFRASGRMRDKWDEVHWSDGTTYGQRTLARSYNKR